MSANPVRLQVLALVPARIAVLTEVVVANQVYASVRLVSATAVPMLQRAAARSAAPTKPQSLNAAVVAAKQKCRFSLENSQAN